MFVCLDFLHGKLIVLVSLHLMTSLCLFCCQLRWLQVSEVAYSTVFIAAGFGPHSNNHVRPLEFVFAQIGIVVDAGVEVKFLHGFLANDCTIVQFSTAFFGNDHEFESECASCGKER